MNLPLASILIAILLQSVTHGLMSDRLNQVDSLLFSTLAFLLTTIIFISIDYIRRQKNYRLGIKEISLIHHISMIIILNLLTALTFIGFYIAISLIPASTASTIEVAVGPLSVIFISILIRSEVKKARDWFFAIILFFLSGLLTIIEFFKVGFHEILSLLLGVSLSFIAGVGASGIAILSKYFGEQNISAITVTAHRFHLTYILSLFFLMFQTTINIDFSEVLVLMVFAFTAVVAPLYFLQFGLQKIDSLLAIILVGTLPNFTYLAQVFFGHSFDIIVFFIINLIIVISIFYSIGFIQLPKKNLKISSS